jgi:hypothetical protein
MTANSPSTASQPTRGSDGRFVRSAATHSPKGTELEEVVAQAKALAGAEWGIVRTWPLESGLVFLAEKMKG